MTPPEGLDNVRRLRDARIDAPGTSEEPPPPGDEEDPLATEKRFFLPEGCPVAALGLKGDVCYYLDQLKQLRELKFKDHSRLNVQGLFGRLADPLLYRYWPRRSQDKNTQEWITTGWKPELAAEALMSACAKEGVWQPFEKVREAGAWRGPSGELLLHCGDQLLIAPNEPPVSGQPHWRVAELGLVEFPVETEETDGTKRQRTYRYVFPTTPATARPHPKPQAFGKDGPGDKLLGLLESWNWRRKDIDAVLLLGWIGAAMIGGALNWRVMAWITGGHGTGKSSLQELVKWLQGENGMLQTSDPSAAAVRQILKFASLPVAIDEGEPESGDSGRKMQALIKLARDAMTGALTIRGGQDHQAVSFIVRSCFLFSSILIPPLLPQDRSRMAILELGQLAEDVKPPAITERGMNELGERLRRRLVDQWHRMADTLVCYRLAMAEAGHSARGQDVFGTLLACAHLMLYDQEPDSDILDGWKAKLAASDLAELQGGLSDEAACLQYLLSTPYENAHDRRRYPIGHWVGRAAQWPGFDNLEMEYLDAARTHLHLMGLKLVTHENKLWLAIANCHQGLSRIFEGSHWAGRPGTQGVWVQALRRLPHFVPKKALWFGVPSKATLIPLEICMPVGESPPDQNQSTAGRSQGDVGDGDDQAHEASGRTAGDPASPSPAPTPLGF